MRRSFIAGLLATLGAGRGRAEMPPTKNLPPVPVWQPSFSQPVDRIVDRISYYNDGKADFAVLRNGTCVILADGLSDANANAFSLKVLADIFAFHPDMNPTGMDDGNILVRYNHPAANVVLSDIAKAHWQEIERRHLDGLTPDEVLITPLGPNKFDDLGKQALLGRAYMFMDAQRPEIIKVVRHH
ncbi:hypothetical protein G4G27_05780 [Sphingomonas sp. So64.6b]|uniref:hypothetical protein n=1 Tax=Sphingomonas sp. So64.6b TaxID=2997354 RepID=UPI0016042941|nr:hypothetical protein [Sphingomonas sp. So64.6b]QNA83567.1 hypothetical protein G4G27_05780 [Sphingomonas sp. So64.6b]